MSTVTASNSYVGHDSGRRRAVTAVGGLVFVVALVASVAAASSPPKADASADAIAGYFRDHHTAAVASTMIGVVAAIAYLCFIGALRASLDGRPGATLIPAAAGAQIAMIGLWLSINGVLAQNVARTANGELTSALFGLGEKAYAAVDTSGHSAGRRWCRGVRIRTLPQMACRIAARRCLPGDAQRDHWYRREKRAVRSGWPG